MGLRACYGAVTAVLVAEAIDKGRGLRLHTVESHRVVLSAVRRGLVT